MKILDPDRSEVVNNADWLAPMVLGELLAYTRQMTVAQLLERDDFSRRFKANEPITLSEFFYPLLQGIDSVEIRSDVELGGTDQTFNNLVGRELQRAKGQAPQAVLTMPLLVGTDGVEKMGKSLGNFIALDASPDEQFGKVMSIPDAAVVTYAQLCTDLHPDEIRSVRTQIELGGAAANGAKRLVAGRIVALYHDETAALTAEQRFNAVFQRGELQQDAPEHALPATDPVHLPSVLVAAGLAASSSAARRPHCRRSGAPGWIHHHGVGLPGSRPDRAHPGRRQAPFRSVDRAMILLEPSIPPESGGLQPCDTRVTPRDLTSSRRHE